MFEDNSKNRIDISSYRDLSVEVNNLIRCKYTDVIYDLLSVQSDQDYKTKELLTIGYIAGVNSVLENKPHKTIEDLCNHSPPELDQGNNTNKKGGKP